ncbi:MAG: hypothetical protein HZA10_02865 [Nitrospirae bacterium]|nr:hypothetical protein [Nitrospirota bacterium]
MPDTISSNRIEPVNFIRLGSSSTDGEDRAWNLNYPIVKGSYTSGYYPEFDIASYSGSTALIPENETYKYKEIIPEEMLEHDIFVKMPPKKKYTIKAKIVCVRKAEPQIVIPEYPYTGS